MTRTLTAALSAAALLAAGCSTMSPVFGDRTVDASALDGEWTTPSGEPLTIDASAGGRLRIADAQARRSGVLLNIDGVTIAEIDLSPDAAEGAAPIYHYGRVELAGDRLTHRPLDPAWLEREVSGREGLVAVEVSDAPSRVAVGDAQAMRALLAKAAQSDEAWGPAQTLTRAR